MLLKLSRCSWVVVSYWQLAHAFVMLHGPYKTNAPLLFMLIRTPRKLALSASLGKATQVGD